MSMTATFMVMMGIGLWSIIWTGLRGREIWSSSQWVKITGTVLSSTMDYQGGGEWPCPKKKDSFFPNIIYRYEVGNRIYTSDCVSFENVGMAEETAQAIADQFNMGEEIEVFYNPKNPRQSVLEPGVPISQFWFLGGGIFMASVGFLGFVALRHPGFIG